MLQEHRKIRPVFLHLSQNIKNRENIFQQTDSKLPDQNIKNSILYTRLLNRIEKIKNNEESEKQQHEKSMDMLSKMIEIAQGEIYQLKYENWELKNTNMLLQEELNEEMEVCKELEEEDYEEMGEENGNESEMSSYNYEQCTGQQSSEINEQSSNTETGDPTQQLTSKKTCSIKNMLISEMSIGQISNAVISSLPISEINQNIQNSYSQQ